MSRKTNGLRPKWNDEDVDTMIDIVIKKDYYKRKLTLFTKTKNQSNGKVYARIKKELQERTAKRNSQLMSTIPMKPKLKKCISDCKNASMTIKTATGIERFQDNQGY